MKFIFSKDIRENKPFKVILLCYMLASLLFYFFMFSLEKINIGLVSRQIKNKILGNEEFFIQAMTLQDLVMQNHIKLFLYLFSSLVILVVFIRTDVAERVKMEASVVLFSLIILDVLFSFLVFLSPKFAFLKMLSFILLQAISVGLCIYNIKFLLKQARQ